MSRVGDEDRDALDPDTQNTASCADCGTDYSKADDDPTPCCDACSDRRDRWADAYQLRRMLKAMLDTDLTNVKEIA